MIRQEAFVNSGKMLKGGLHCHTTRSDGRGTPEEVIRMHVEHGYDFLALTDHRFYNYKNFTDLPITIIPGMEMDVRFKGEEKWATSHCFHSVCIGPAREDGNGYAQDERISSGFVSGQEEYQAYLDAAHARGNMTTICHPQWSATPPRQFEKLQGCFAMELWNSGCVIETDCDYDNGFYWDELLIGGKKIFGVATDDGHAMYQHCLGWVCVNSENNISAILKALEKGAFYSSCGPEIRDFRIDDDGTAHVECSEAKYVVFYTGNCTPRKFWNHDDKPVTEAKFNVPDYAAYVRAMVMDEQGRRAWTNPIFIKEEQFK